MSELRLDRSAFRAGKLEDQERLDARHWMTKTVNERMRASWYMTCKAYGYSEDNPPVMDRTAFRAEKRFQ